MLFKIFLRDILFNKFNKTKSEEKTMDKKVASLLNDQINKELYSAYLYLDFSNYYAEEGLEGFSNWYYIQAREEREHAEMFLKYMKENGVKVTLEAIAKPDKKLNSLKAPLAEGLEHEKYVTSLIYNIYEAASEAKDYRTMHFLDWFIKEQGEEESNAEGLVKKFELFGNDAKSLYMLDKELLARK